jgi:hypothetical protein
VILEEVQRVPELFAVLRGVTSYLERYIDVLCDLMLVRRLPAWSGNVGKRLVRSPKVYVRDSGLTHALLGLPSFLSRFMPLAPYFCFRLGACLWLGY